MPTDRPTNGPLRLLGLVAATIGYTAAYLAVVAVVYVAGWLAGLV